MAVTSYPLWIHVVLFLLGSFLLVTTIWPDLKGWIGRRRPPPVAVDFVKANAIVEGYIHPATHDKQANVRISIRNDFIRRFDKTTGAKLGVGQYNSELLHQWMQTNAARLLVEHRGEMK